MAEHIRMKAEYPEDATTEEATTVRAEAIYTGLSMAAKSADMRLHMILGEAYQKYTEIFRWLANEIEKDEEKVPGLIALAKKWASDPSLLINGYSKFMSDAIGAVQQRLIEDAATRMSSETSIRAEPDQ